jgi:hypothetical protein
MDRWSTKDVTGRLRAQKLLEGCERLVRHGHKREALGKIAGGVVHGFIDAATVQKELRIAPEDLSAALIQYRETYKD